MADMLELAAHLPEIEIAPGHVLCAEGQPSGSIYVLVDGALKVRKNGVEVNTISRPGALIGEVSVLLGTGSTASVVADTPCRLRVAADGAGLLNSDPRISAFVATGLAERLNFLTTYLADLKVQYGDAPGLAMVGQVLNELATRQGPRARPGSRREPDPQY